MSERTRVRMIAAFLVVTVLVCAAVSVDSMQRDLLVRTQRALAGAGVAFYGVEMDGRDAVLSGFVPSREQADRIEAIVQTVPGVRAVRSDLVIERIVEPPTGPGAVTSSALALPSLRLQRLGDRVMLAGTLPDDGTAEALAAAATQRYGEDNVRDSMRRSGSTGSSPWIEAAATLLDLLDALEDNGRLTITGTSAHLFGQVRNRAQRDEIEQTARDLSSLRWRFDLLTSDGATGGGAP